MKKIYVLLLLTTNVLSPSCMEKQCSKWHNKNDSTEIPLTVINQTTTPDTVPLYINEPDWEIYNKIMNITYKNNQPVIINPTDLTPVYPSVTNNAAQTKKPLEQNPTTLYELRRAQAEKKPLLRTITPVPPDANIMEKLYKSLYNDTKTLIITILIVLIH